MLGLRRNPSQGDGPTARFLYAILRQLDTRSVDWNQVAEDVECTNGHAARMRFSRFRQHMEGSGASQRQARDSPDRREAKKAKRKKAKSDAQADESQSNAGSIAKRRRTRTAVKRELSAEPSATPESNIASPSETDDPFIEQESAEVKEEQETEGIVAEVKPEPSIKDEPFDDYHGQEFIQSYNHYPQGESYGIHSNFEVKEDPETVSEATGFDEYAYHPPAPDMDGTAMEAEMRGIHQEFMEACRNFEAEFINYHDDEDGTAEGYNYNFTESA